MVPFDPVRDLVQMRRLGERKRAENQRFRAYVKSHDFSERRFRRAAEQIESQIDCRSCANCCRVAAIPITDRDAGRLAKHLGMELTSFLAQYTDRDDEGMIMRRTGNGCVFLDGNDCTVYEARPRVCSDFPHLVRGEGSIAHRMWAFIDRACYCPIAYNAMEWFKADIGFRR